MNPAIMQLGRNYPDILSCLSDVETAYALLEASFSAGGKLLVCGNGGSAYDADHIVAEMVKGFLLKRSLSATVCARLRDAYGGEGAYLAHNLQGALPAISLGAHIALSTAFSNDVASDMVFAQQVHAYGRSGDVLIGLSTSGRKTVSVRPRLSRRRSPGVARHRHTRRDASETAAPGHPARSARPPC